MGLAENASALQHWMVSGPEMARIIEEFQASTDKVGIATDTISTMRNQILYRYHLPRMFNL